MRLLLINILLISSLKNKDYSLEPIPIEKLKEE